MVYTVNNNYIEYLYRGGRLPQEAYPCYLTYVYYQGIVCNIVYPKEKG